MPSFDAGEAPRRSTSSLEPMAGHRTLISTSLCALLLPALLIFITSATDAMVDVMSNWMLMAAPQAVVIAMALVFPSLRVQFATYALASLSIMLLIFWWITSSRVSGANGAMLWAFYLPASAIIVLVVWLLPPRKGKSRGL